MANLYPDQELGYEEEEDSGPKMPEAFLNKVICQYNFNFIMVLRLNNQIE